jgi:AcrR family transcriptional regulator
MSKQNGETAAERIPLSRERLLRGAIAVADAGGIAALTMRSLAQELSVKPMSLYHHVANKEEIIDGIIEVVFTEIELPATDGDWRTAMRRRANSARAVLRRHSWATPLMESRPTPGPANLQHHDAVIGALRSGDLSVAESAHAYSVLDSYIYGFALTEAGLPFEGPDDVADMAQEMLAQFPVDTYPHLAELMREHIMKPGYDYGNEFEVGLDLILDGIAKNATSRNDPAQTSGPIRDRPTTSA